MFILLTYRCYVLSIFMKPYGLFLLYMTFMHLFIFVLFFPYPTLRESIHSYFEQLSDLDQTVRRMVLETLGLENYLNENMDSTTYFARVMKYKGSKMAESNLGMKSHTDTSTVTILCQNQAGGLELQTKDGEWINVTGSQDAFIVMIGDALHPWTNGRLRSPHHRVIMRGDETRYSAGPEELIDELPLLFKPYDVLKYQEFYFSEAGQREHSTLKAYCGV